MMVNISDRYFGHNPFVVGQSYKTVSHFLFFFIFSFFLFPYFFYVAVVTTTAAANGKFSFLEKRKMEERRANLTFFKKANVVRYQFEKQ